MQLPDVNVLVYAHRPDSAEHADYAAWLRDLASGPEPFALSENVLAGFLRIVTSPRIFPNPTPLPVALAFVDELVKRPTARLLRPGEQHFAIFIDLLKTTSAKGTFVADVHHAALAIEHGCEWITNDADFSRIPGLRWRHPLRVRQPVR